MFTNSNVIARVSIKTIHVFFIYNKPSEGPTIEEINYLDKCEKTALCFTPQAI